MARTRWILLAAAILALLPRPGSAPGAAPAAQAPAAQAPAEAERKREEEAKRKEEVRRAREARLQEIRRKVDAIGDLIKETNQSLKLRTSGYGVFERKRALENRLRDLITLFALTNRAIAEADRLAREVEELRRTAQKGPPDPRRLQLANFLEARQREYILFGTR